MKSSRLFALACLAFLLIACSLLSSARPEAVPTAPATGTPQPAATTAEILSSSATPDQPEPPIPGIATPDSARLTAEPQTGRSRSLYMLADHGVWVIKHDTAQAIRLTSPDSIVTAFDVLPSDGRLAYATQSGKLYVNFPGEDPKLLMELAGKSELPAFITSLDWSPKGDMLAFSVDFDNQGNNLYLSYPAYPSGIWSINVFDYSATWLRSQRYLASTTDDVNNLLMLHNPMWSPDQLSLLLQGGYWEWSNFNWLFPLQFSEDTRFLTEVKTDPAGGVEGWMNAAWLPDGKSLLISGKMYAQYGGMVYYDLEHNQAKTLIDGEMAKLYIYDAYPVPDESYLPGDLAGIGSGPGRFVFLAKCPDCSNGNDARIYVEVFIDGSLQGQAVGPEKLCSNKDSYGNDNYAHAIEWSPDFSGGVLVCGGNEMYMLDMGQPSPSLTDILPYLPPRPDGEVPLFRWGEK